MNPSQFLGQSFHKRMTHPGPSSMRQHQHPPRISRPQQQCRHLASPLHRNPHLSIFRHFAAILAEPK
jgi:hypothetical protein